MAILVGVMSLFYIFRHCYARDVWAVCDGSQFQCNILITREDPHGHAVREYIIHICFDLFFFCGWVNQIKECHTLFEICVSTLPPIGVL